jgi:NADH:ubiquinone oxidoreductase subunit 5 (subunit L)/multisubunit Na+/H+ antiporter MnhA subunit
MPFTGTLFTINAMGLSGLPPLNGFLGELAIYIGAFHLIKSGTPPLIAAGFLTILSLAIAGGMAVAVYTKSIGGVFLGSPRSQEAENAVETPKIMWVAQLILTILSLAMIPGSIFIIHDMVGGFATHSLISAAVAGVILTFLTAALVILRNHVCAKGDIKTISEVWDCGYDNPTSRMAYTATAFTQPLADLLQPLLNIRRHIIAFKGDPSNPSDAAIATETDDIAIKGFWRPIFTYVARIFQMIHLLQNGSLHFYILIILLAMLALLVSALVS